MNKPITKLPVKHEKGEGWLSAGDWRPFESLHREIDRLFEDFGRTSWRWPLRRRMLGVEPFWRGEVSTLPAVDVAEDDKAYEITAELPGIEEQDIALTVSGDTLSITGEKSDEKEEKKKDYYLSERRYGSFERSFRLPEGVDADKIEATFKKGVLTVTLPKRPEAQKPEKKITVKAA